MYPHTHVWVGLLLGVCYHPPPSLSRLAQTLIQDNMWRPSMVLASPVRGRGWAGKETDWSRCLFIVLLFRGSCQLGKKKKSSWNHTLLTDAERKREKISLEGQDTPETGNKGVLAFQKYSELVSRSLEKKILLFSCLEEKGKEAEGETGEGEGESWVGRDGEGLGRNQDQNKLYGKTLL